MKTSYYNGENTPYKNSEALQKAVNAGGVVQCEKSVSGVNGNAFINKVPSVIPKSLVSQFCIDFDVDL